MANSRVPGREWSPKDQRTQLCQSAGGRGKGKRGEGRSHLPHPSHRKWPETSGLCPGGQGRCLEKWMEAPGNFYFVSSPPGTQVELQITTGQQ